MYPRLAPSSPYLTDPLTPRGLLILAQMAMPFDIWSQTLGAFRVTSIVSMSFLFGCFIAFIFWTRRSGKGWASFSLMIMMWAYCDQDLGRCGHPSEQVGLMIMIWAYCHQAWIQCWGCLNSLWQLPQFWQLPQEVLMLLVSPLDRSRHQLIVWRGSYANHHAYSLHHAYRLQKTPCQAQWECTWAICLWNCICLATAEQMVTATFNWVFHYFTEYYYY